MPKHRIWTGALAIDSRGGSTAFGCYLKTPSGQLIFQAAERLGNVTDLLAMSRGYHVLWNTCRKHKASPLKLVASPVESWAAHPKVLVVAGQDDEALALAQNVLPAAPVFEIDGLTFIEPHHYVAHGREDYQVWTRLGVCSCPAFTYGKTRPCKHLRAALAIEQQRTG